LVDAQGGDCRCKRAYQVTTTRLAPGFGCRWPRRSPAAGPRAPAPAFSWARVRRSPPIEGTSLSLPLCWSRRTSPAASWGRRRPRRPETSGPPVPASCSLSGRRTERAAAAVLRWLSWLSGPSWILIPFRHA